MDRDERTFDSLNANPIMAVTRQPTPVAFVESKNVVFLSAVHHFRMLKADCSIATRQWAFTTGVCNTDTCRLSDGKTQF